jgi:hypothetical protein
MSDSGDIVFPELSTYASISGHKDTIAYDPSIRSQMEDGTIISRAKFTSTKKKFTLQYLNLTDNDKALLENMQEEAMVGADLITWTHPKTEKVYLVRLEKPLLFKMHNDDPTKWDVSLDFIED